MPGSINDLYVLARRVLLDALEALEEHRNAVILVGAQAIYLHTGDADIAVAASTLDADLAIDPTILKSTPLLADAMVNAGFVRRDQPGIWESQREGVEVDILVPEALGGDEGRRGARLGVHGDRVARKARGLEAALVDHMRMEVAALDATDLRHIEVAVAGTAALLVAKLHKIAERRDDPKRIKSKDALDVYRLLKMSSPDELVDTFNKLRQDAHSQLVTAEAISHLRDLFGNDEALGSRLAGQAVEPLEDPYFIAASAAALANELLSLL